MTSFEPTGCNPEGNEDGGTGDRGDGCRNNEARVEGIIKKEEQKSVKSLKSGVEKEREGRKEGLNRVLLGRKRVQVSLSILSLAIQQQC